MLLLNTGANTSTISCKLADSGLPQGASAVRDLWAHSNGGAIAAGGNLTASLKSHSNAFYILTPP